MLNVLNLIKKDNNHTKMVKVLEDFQRRLAKVETNRKNKATTIKLVAAFPPILSYDEWEAIAMPQQQQLVEETRHD